MSLNTGSPDASDILEPGESPLPSDAIHFRLVHAVTEYDTPGSPAKLDYLILRTYRFARLRRAETPGSLAFGW